MRIDKGIDLYRYSTMRTHSMGAVMYTPESIDELIGLMSELQGNCYFLGESNISTLLKNKTIPSGLKDYVSGVICVSTKNKEESISLGLTTEEKCFVKPNAVNSELFKKLDKETCRKKLGLPADAFIISFVGSFIERKGANRVAAAIKSLSGDPVYSIFAGRGNVEPDCENILFKGSLRHEDIPEYLNASDVFVLPTLAEGCCNAIVEAHVMWSSHYIIQSSI